jgi:hypothetical protein
VKKSPSVKKSHKAKHTVRRRRQRELEKKLEGAEESERSGRKEIK